MSKKLMLDEITFFRKLLRSAMHCVYKC